MGPRCWKVSIPSRFNPNRGDTNLLVVGLVLLAPLSTVVALSNLEQVVT
jgi:hypothetical protein